jgi:hypothetical protein
MRSSSPSDARLLNVGIPGAAAGVSIGAVVGLVVGAVIGAAVGWYNEASLVGEAYEDLFIGLAEYSMPGMAFWCALVCTVCGGITGGVSGAIAWATRRPSHGI